MNPRPSRDLLQRLPWAIPLLLALAPAAVVVADVLTYRGASPLGQFARETLWSAIGARSVVAAMLAGLVAAVVGLAPGLALASRPPGWRLLLLAVWLAGLALPSVFLAGVWSHLLELGPAPPRSNEAEIARWLALCLAWGLSLAPLCSLIVALTVSRISRGELAAGALFLPPARRWGVVVLPRLLGGLALAAAAAGALAFTDAGAPAHFGVQTVASRASFEFLSTLETAPPGIVVLPPWLAAGALVWLLASRDVGRGRENTGGLVGLPTWPITAICTGLTVAVPAIALGVTAGSALAPLELARYLPEIGNSLEYALAGGLAAAAVATLAIMCEAATLPDRGRRLLLAGAALALCAPGMAAGYTALLAQIHLGGPQAGWWWPGFLLLRCVPWCLPLLVWSGGTSTSRAALALGLAPSARALAALRERGPALGLAAALAGAAGALREFEYFAAFGLPNGESLAARAAQMLHFGMRPPLAALMLVQLAIALVWSLVTMLLWRRRG